MAKTAHAQGIPESAIFLEPEARNTIQNACYSMRIMNAHGWRSAEVVSSASHMARAGIIFSQFPLEWRSHAAPPLAPESSAHHTLVRVRRNIENSALPDLGALGRPLRTIASANAVPASLSPVGVVL